MLGNTRDCPTPHVRPFFPQPQHTASGRVLKTTHLNPVWLWGSGMGLLGPCSHGAFPCSGSLCLLGSWPPSIPKATGNGPEPRQEPLGAGDVLPGDGPGVSMSTRCKGLGLRAVRPVQGRKTRLWQPDTTPLCTQTHLPDPPGPAHCLTPNVNGAASPVNVAKGRLLLACPVPVGASPLRLAVEQTAWAKSGPVAAHGGLHVGRSVGGTGRVSVQTKGAQHSGHSGRGLPVVLAA